MTQVGPAGGLAGQAGRLESAIGYALGTVQVVTPDLLSRPTPCRGWDLRMLLRHACESLAALGEGVDAGRVGLRPCAGDDNAAADPARAFRERAGLLLGAWTSAGRQHPSIAIADRCLTPDIVAAAGAIEIAVHGRDLSRACGHREPIPPAPAADPLPVARPRVPPD